MGPGRFKSYDYAVLGLFALVVIGVSLSWYTISVTLEDQVLGAADSGWHYTWGILAFVAALIAVIMVLGKAASAQSGSLPRWYKQGPIVIGLGDLVTLFAIIGFIDRPGRGVDVFGLVSIGYGAGIYLTLVAGLLMGGCGVLALLDKLRATAGAGTPGEAVDAVPPTICKACGMTVEPGSGKCRSCGEPQG
jgi:hypothetical protein